MFFLTAVSFICHLHMYCLEASFFVLFCFFVSTQAYQGNPADAFPRTFLFYPVLFSFVKSFDPERRLVENLQLLWKKSGETFGFASHITLNIIFSCPSPQMPHSFKNNLQSKGKQAFFMSTKMVLILFDVFLILELLNRTPLANAYHSQNKMLPLHEQGRATSEPAMLLIFT